MHEAGSPQVRPRLHVPRTAGRMRISLLAPVPLHLTPHMAPKYSWGFYQPKVPNPHNIAEQILIPHSRLSLTFCRCHSFSLVSYQHVPSKVLKPTTRITSFPSSLLHASPISLQLLCLLCPHPLPRCSGVTAPAPQCVHECMRKQEGREIGLLQSSAAAQSSKQLWLCHMGARLPSLAGGR